jgi:hypothetical protein
LTPKHLIALLTTAITAVLVAATVAAGAQLSESIYVDGQTYQINTGAAVKLDASDALLANATPFYIIGFPVAPGTVGPITLPSGYQPQNNGLPSPIRYHDHVTTGAPGRGNSGTAGEYKAPLRVVEMRYSWDYAYSSSFVPIMSVDEIPAAEAAGKLQIINPGAFDPYQIWTTTVLIRPIVSGP